MEKIHISYRIKLNREPDFLVAYRFFTPEEGGRVTGTPTQGYRSDFRYEHPEHTKGRVFMIWPEFLDEDDEVITDNILPVRWSGKAYMWIIANEMRPYHKDKIKVGLNGFFVEENKKVAECDVIQVLK